MPQGQRVQQAGAETVGQQACGQVESRCVLVLVRRAVEGIHGYLDERDLRLDLHVPDAREGLHLDRSLLGRLAAADAPEGALQQRLEPILVEVSAEDQAHVAADIVFVEEGHHLAQTGILQVLGAAYDLVRVGIAAAELLDHLEERGLHRVVRAAVLLLVHRLQFALEETEYGIDHTVAVQFCPLLDVLRGERIVIVGVVVGGRGVEARAAEAGYEAVELVGDGVFGGLLAQAPYLLLDALPFAFVGGAGKPVIADRDGVQPDLLGLVIHGADFFRALEEQVLKVMGETGVRAVLGARLYDDGAIYDGLGRVAVQPDLHSVREFELSYFKRIVLCVRGDGHQRSRKE